METPVRLMTRSGDVVLLPHDLRVPFARLLGRLPPPTTNSLHLKRYTFGRVVKEKKVFGLHPKELTECAFDIVSVPAGRVLADAELLLVCQEVVQAGLAIKKTTQKTHPKKPPKKPTKNVFLFFLVFL
jgi:translation initiation factor 2-alpha kinase 4